MTICNGNIPIKNIWFGQTPVKAVYNGMVKIWPPELPVSGDWALFMGSFSANYGTNSFGANATLRHIPSGTLFSFAISSASGLTANASGCSGTATLSEGVVGDWLCGGGPVAVSHDKFTDIWTVSFHAFPLAMATLYFRTRTYLEGWQ